VLGPGSTDTSPAPTDWWQSFLNSNFKGGGLSEDSRLTSALDSLFGNASDDLTKIHYGNLSGFGDELQLSGFDPAQFPINRGFQPGDLPGDGAAMAMIAQQNQKGASSHTSAPIVYAPRLEILPRPHHSAPAQGTNVGGPLGLVSGGSTLWHRLHRSG
jgi:hypothetical protein